MLVGHARLYVVSNSSWAFLSSLPRVWPASRPSRTLVASARPAAQDSCGPQARPGQPASRRSVRLHRLHLLRRLRLSVDGSSAVSPTDAVLHRHQNDGTGVHGGPRAPGASDHPSPSPTRIGAADPAARWPALEATDPANGSITITVTAALDDPGRMVPSPSPEDQVPDPRGRPAQRPDPAAAVANRSRRIPSAAPNPPPDTPTTKQRYHPPLDHRQRGPPPQRPTARPPRAVDALEQRRPCVPDAAAGEIRLEGFCGPMMGRHVVAPAALLVQPQPPPHALPVSSPRAASHRRADPREACTPSRSAAPGPAARRASPCRSGRGARASRPASAPARDPSDQRDVLLRAAPPDAGGSPSTCDEQPSGPGFSGEGAWTGLTDPRCAME